MDSLRDSCRHRRITFLQEAWRKGDTRGEGRGGGYTPSVMQNGGPYIRAMVEVRGLSWRRDISVPGVEEIKTIR